MFDQVCISQENPPLGGQQSLTKHLLILVIWEQQMSNWYKLQNCKIAQQPAIAGTRRPIFTIYHELPHAEQGSNPLSLIVQYYVLIMKSSQDILIPIQMIPEIKHKENMSSSNDKLIIVCPIMAGKHVK